MKNLKDYREKELKYYTISCILFLIYLENRSISSEQIISIKNINLVLISSSVYIFSIIFDSLFAYKESIITIFGLIKMPGEKIFSNIKSKKIHDIRFDNEEVYNIYKSIYDSMAKNKNDRYKYENKKWYKIYDRYKDNPMIFNSNRDYLLCRDSLCNTLFNLFIYMINLFTIKTFNFNKLYIFFLIIMIIISFIATHSKASKLVNNVIALDFSNSCS